MAKHGDLEFKRLLANKVRELDHAKMTKAGFERRERQCSKSDSRLDLLVSDLLDKR